MSKSLVIFSCVLWVLTGFSNLKKAQAQSALSVSSYGSAPGNSVWQVGAVTLNLGSRFFFGASAHRKFSPHWGAGLRAGTALDFSSNQSFASGFGRWSYGESDHFFAEASATALSGFSSGSQLLGIAIGTHQSITRNWQGEFMVGYEGIDRLLSPAAISSWSTARIQIGLIRNL